MQRNVVIAVIIIILLLLIIAVIVGMHFFNRRMTRGVTEDADVVEEV